MLSKFTADTRDFQFVRAEHVLIQRPKTRRKQNTLKRRASEALSSHPWMLLFSADQHCGHVKHDSGRGGTGRGGWAPKKGSALLWPNSGSRLERDNPGKQEVSLCSKEDLCFATNVKASLRQASYRWPPCRKETAAGRAVERGLESPTSLQPFWCHKILEEHPQVFCAPEQDQAGLWERR